MFKVVAPAFTTASITLAKYSLSVRPASSAKNSTSSVKLRANLTALTARSIISSRVALNLYLICKSEVPIPV